MHVGNCSLISVERDTVDLDDKDCVINCIRINPYSKKYNTVH